jgi:hypothetical protein
MFVTRKSTTKRTPMKVNIGQFEFETDDMTRYPTGVACMPFIFVQENGGVFLQLSRARWPAPKMRHVGRGEALRLAACYKLDDLTKRLCPKPLHPAAPTSKRLDPCAGPPMTSTTDFEPFPA